jgi:branched-chain amino acid transport system substrate-binding protein
MLAVEEINSRGGIGGRPIEQVVVDVDMLDPDAVREGMAALFDQEVDAITTSYLSAENPFVLDLAADHGKPFLHTATFEEQVDLVRSDPSRYGNIFQTCPSETYYGNGFVRLLDDLKSRSSWQPHNRRIVSVEVDALSTRTTNDTFLDAALQSGWELSELIRVPLGTRDWGDVVARIAALDPAAVMVTHFVADEIVELQRALHALGSPALVYYVYGASVPQFQDSLREAAEGVVWSTVTGLYDDALGRAFRQRYRRRFVLEPGWSIASAAYDQVRLLANAWAATGGRDSRDVADYLRQTAHRGLNGVYFLGSPGQACLAYPDMTPDPSISQAHMVYQYQDGVARVIAPSFNGAVEAFRPPRAS